MGRLPILGVEAEQKIVKIYYKITEAQIFSFKG